jgi:DNA-binding MarR family transcriptional regulator
LREAHHLSTRQLLHSNLEPAETAVWFLVFKNEVPRPSDVAAEMGLDPSSVLRPIEALEADGYLVKVKDPQDGRSHRRRLIPTGRKAIAKAMTQQAVYDRGATACWSANDLGTVVTLHSRLTEDLKAHHDLEKGSGGDSPGAGLL